jgi:2-polyprenyl-3-methyl-5-hydroxy-6-metoxy-1,4-benzoquinol methylase
MRSGDSAERYDGLWQGGWRSARDFPGVSLRTRRRLLFRHVDRIWRPHMDVLDVGCGDGMFLQRIAARYADVGRLCGVDVSDSALAQARERLPEAELRQCDLPSPLANGPSFDLITCSEVLEHVGDYQLSLRHMCEALRPRGTLLISVPHSMRHWGAHDQAAGHLRRFETSDFCAAVAATGLRVTRAYTWGALLYELYCRAVLENASPQFTWKPKSAPVRLAHRLLYYAFFLDDLFTRSGGGRMLFVEAQKPCDDGAAG